MIEGASLAFMDRETKNIFQFIPQGIEEFEGCIILFRGKAEIRAK